MAQATMYRVKHIGFPLLAPQRTAAVVLQNVNGPCPLIAICNVLFLRGQLEIHQDIGVISEEELMQLLSSFLLSRTPMGNSEEEIQNFNRNLNDAMSIFPKLAKGLDVNVKFNSFEGFEPTLDVLFFELLNIRLVHGWVVDLDHPNCAVIRSHSYNSATEKIVMSQLSKDKPTLLPTPPHRVSSIDSAFAPSSPPKPSLTSSSSSIPTPTLSSSGNSIPSGLSSSQSNNPFLKPMVNPFLNPAPSPFDPNPFESSPTLSEGQILEDFIMKESPTQLTFRGLVELHKNLKENELCVFFRNNHFSTLFKREDALYLLLTDEGFKNKKDIVWEVLSEISGDSQFVDEEFKLHISSPRDREEEKEEFKLAQGMGKDDFDENKEMEALKQMNLTDDEIIKELELRKSEKLALKLQREEERLVEKERLGEKERLVDKERIPEYENDKEEKEESSSGVQGEADLLRKSEKLAMKLQKKEEEKQSLALARQLQEEDELSTRASSDAEMARKLQEQFNRENEGSDDEVPNPRAEDHDLAHIGPLDIAPEPRKSKSPRTHHHGKEKTKEKKKKKDDDCSLQ